MFSIHISRNSEYKPGDLGFMVEEGGAWLVEVQGVHNWGYDARITRLHLNKETGRYSIKPEWGTFSGVPKDKMQRLRLDKIDFDSLATWQKYVDNVRDRMTREIGA